MYITQMRINALRTTEDAVNMLPVPTHLIVSTAPVIMDTSAMDLPAQVIYMFHLIMACTCFNCCIAFLSLGHFKNSDRIRFDS